MKVVISNEYLQVLANAGFAKKETHEGVFFEKGSLHVEFGFGPYPDGPFNNPCIFNDDEAWAEDAKSPEELGELLALTELVAKHPEFALRRLFRTYYVNVREGTYDKRIEELESGLPLDLKSQLFLQAYDDASAYHAAVLLVGPFLVKQNE